MINTLLAITFYDIPTEETDRLVGYLTLSCTLFDGLEILYRIFGTTESILHISVLCVDFDICVCGYTYIPIFINEKRRRDVSVEMRG